VQVPYAGETYNLRVLEVQPGGAVSVIDTDIAADVGPSIETEGYLRAQEEAEAREAERQRQAREAAEHEAAQVRRVEWNLCLYVWCRVSGCACVVCDSPAVLCICRQCYAGLLRFLLSPFT
jgi:hypothetical protein